MRDPQLVLDIERMNEPIKQTLSSTYVLLYYYEDQRPGTKRILSDNIQLTLDQRNSIKVLFFVSQLLGERRLTIQSLLRSRK